MIHFPPAQKILLTAAQYNCESGLEWKALSRATEGAIRASREDAKGRNRPSFDPGFRHFAAPLASLFAKIRSGRRLAYPAGRGGEAIRRTVLPNSRRARWLSVRNSR